MRILNDQIFNAGNISGDVATSAIKSQFILAASLQVEITGSSPVGVLRLQASNYIPTDSIDVPGANDWSDIATANINGTGDYIIPATDICYRFIRAFYDRTSGTGAISGNIKTIGV